MPLPVRLVCASCKTEGLHVWRDQVWTSSCCGVAWVSSRPKFSAWVDQSSNERRSRGGLSAKLFSGRVLSTST